ncbi:hypothetical protein E3P89_02437 [Wallemia ichthyophaga]|nr:hypothetical protein E3P89_02437 [Wallemia ichthyophaga]
MSFSDKDKNWDDGLDDAEAEMDEDGQSTRDASIFVVDVAGGMLDYPPSEIPSDRVEEELPLLHRTLNAILKCLKRKAFNSPNDFVGIALYNTQHTQSDKDASDVREHVYCFQPIEQLNGNNIRKLKKLVDSAHDDPDLLSRKFKPATFQGSRTSMPIGNLYMSCNRFFRNNPHTKSATKRIFHVTCNDQPNKGAPSEWLTATQTNANDLKEAGIYIEPFFIAPPQPNFDTPTCFDASFFYTHVLPKTDSDSYSNENLPNFSMVQGLAKFNTLEEKLKKLETPKRTSFTHKFELGANLTISVKGYRTVVDQKYFPYVLVAENKHGELELTEKETRLKNNLDETVERSETNRGFIVGDKSSNPVVVTCDTKAYNSLRSFDLPVGMKLLGFQDLDTLSVMHNVSSASFIYPTEDIVKGSTKLFSALLKSCLKKKKLALVRAVMRKNAGPVICALIPQEEVVDNQDGSQIMPNGFYLIPLPFADDLRSPPDVINAKATEDQIEASAAWLKKLRKKSGYDANEYENPYFRLMRKNIESQALDEPMDEDDIKKDKTLPPVEQMEKRAGNLIDNWRRTWDFKKEEPVRVKEEEEVGSQKRKKDDVTEVGMDDGPFLEKMRYNQLEKCRLDELKSFCRANHLPVQGRKAELIMRIKEKLTRSYGIWLVSKCFVPILRLCFVLADLLLNISLGFLGTLFEFRNVVFGVERGRLFVLGDMVWTKDLSHELVIQSESGNSQVSMREAVNLFIAIVGLDERRSPAVFACIRLVVGAAEPVLEPAVAVAAPASGRKPSDVAAAVAVAAPALELEVVRAAAVELVVRGVPVRVQRVAVAVAVVVVAAALP